MNHFYSDKMIFVFGSNEAGIHGAGAAAFAHKVLGAKYGVGVGITGFTYAIPTKDFNIETLGLDKIEEYIVEFLEYARKNSDVAFNLTPIGCGLAGYNKIDIMRILNKHVVPQNVMFDSRWFGFNE